MKFLRIISLLWLIPVIALAQQGGGGPPGGAAHSVQVKTTQNTFGGISPGTAGWILTSNGVGADPSFQAGSGGGSPAGSNTQIQFNNAGSFGADAGLSYVGSTTQTITFGVTGTSPSLLTTPNNGSGGAPSLKLTTGTSTTNAAATGKITIQPGDSSGTTNTLTARNNVSISGGTNTSTANGGRVSIAGGNNTGTGSAGDVVITGGTPTAGNGGPITISGSSGVGVNQTGGAVSIIGGGGVGTSAAGAVTITGGNNANSGAGGDVTLTGGTSSSGTIGSVSIVTNGSTRVKVDGSGAWIIGGSAGTAGQVITSGGSGAAVSWASAGRVAFAQLSVSGASCSVNSSYANSNLSGCFYSSAGTYSLSFSPSAFNNPPVCFISVSDAGGTSPVLIGYTSFSALPTSGGAIVNVRAASTGALTDPTNGVFVYCTGT